jgi:predicted lactoylglutathione lyase
MNRLRTGVAMTLELPGAVPEIPVRDINEAAAYYENNLGFTVDWGGEELGLAGISKGNCRMFLANSEYRKQSGSVGPVLIWLNLNSKDEVNDLFRLWSSSGAKLISEPESKPWGLHGFMAKDLDGNLFRVFYDFGTSESGNDA